MFDTFSKNIVFECRMAFNLPLVSDIIRKQKMNFLVRYCASDNLVCKVFASNAELEIKSLHLNYKYRLPVHLEPC